MAPHGAQQHQMHLACVMRSCLHHRRPRLCRDTCLCRVTNAHGRISCMHVQYVSPVHSYHVQRAALPTTHISVSHTQPFWQLLPTYAYLSIPHAAFLAPNTHSRVFFPNLTFLEPITHLRVSLHPTCSPWAPQSPARASGPLSACHQ